MCEFYKNHIRLEGDEVKKLAEYRDININRLKSGLDKLGEAQGTKFPYHQYDWNQGGYAMHTLNQHPDNAYDIDVALVFKKEHLPGSALEARKRIADAFIKVGGNFSKEPGARTNAVTVWYAEGYHVDFAIYRTYTDIFGSTVIEHAGPDWTPRDPVEVTN
jgi:hypothetical protein